MNQETKDKISRANTGKKRTDESKKKMSLAKIGKKNTNGFKKGQKFTEEHKKRLSESHKGQIFTKETREKMSLSSIGKHKYWLGKKMSDEHRKKMSLSQKGDKSPQWKGGITPEIMRIRHSFEIRLWRSSVFQRDNFTCQKCKVSGGKLEAHHINNFSDFPELRTSIENGITLCKQHHIQFHKIYTKRNNTKEQLTEFLNNKL